MARSPNDITAYRRRSKQKRFIKKLIIFAVLLVAAAVIVLNAQIIFEPLNGIGARIDNKTSTSQGFPVRLPGSAEYSFKSFGSNFVLLTDTYLYNYLPSGAQAYAFQHGYGSPMMCVGDTRILIYNHNAHEFSLFNKGSRIYEGNHEEKIISGYLGNNDMTAIVTVSSRFSNIIYVYDRNGKQKFIRRFVDENVTGVDFSKDGTQVFVSTVKVERGENAGFVYGYSLSSEENAVWSYRIPSGSWGLSIKASDLYLFVLGDNVFLTLDILTGELVGSYSYGGQIRYADFGDAFNIVGLNDNISNNNILVLLDGNSAAISSKIMPITLKQVEIYRDMVYTLDSGSIKCYDNSLEQINEYPLEEEYDGFVIIGDSAYLLGYDLVEKRSLAEQF